MPSVQSGGAVPVVVSNPGQRGVPGPPGINFAPERTLFVAQSWPVGVDPAIYFTSIPSALSQAGTLTPTRSNPVAIVIYPGTYSDNLTLVSCVSLFGIAKEACRLTGDITWNAGQGVNAPLINAREEIGIYNLRVIGSNFFVDTTAKTGDLSVLDTNGCSWVDNFVVVNRPGAHSDYFQCFNIYFSDITITDGVADIRESEILANTNTFIFNGDCDLTLSGCSAFQDLVLNGTGNANHDQIVGCYFDANVTVNDTRKPFIAGSNVKGNLTVAAGAYADIRSSEVPQANISGAGQIDRRVTRITTGATAIGATVIPINPPLSSNNYNVSVALVSGPGSAAFSIDTKNNTDFTIHDPIGGNVWELTVIQD